MSQIKNWTAVLLIACLTVLTPLTVSAQTGNITCESMGGQYNYCRVDTQNQVTLTNQISNSSCEKDYSWGYDYRGIWVDRGCRAEFKYGRGSAKGGLIAAGILGALLIGAAAASSKSKNSGGNVDPEKKDTYNQGYRYGKQDWDQGVESDYRSHNNHYTSQYESDFSSGYNDGYHNRPNKYQ